jgi:ribosome biogenesis GTPase A
MITGIPNVGKSTLINAVAGRKVAKTGNEPAITKGQQKINTVDGVILLDTPGILWPKIHNENSGYRLAATGAIRDTAMNVEDVAFYLSEFLLRQYPGVLLERYELDVIPETEDEFLELMGVRRGCIRSGGRVDLERVSSILVNEFRSGKLGPISLETPQMIVHDEAILKAKQIDKTERDATRKQKHRSGRNNSG